MDIWRKNNELQPDRKQCRNLAWSFHMVLLHSNNLKNLVYETQSSF